MKRVMFPLLFLIAAAPAWPRVAVVFRQATQPLPVQAGQQFTLCAANVGTANADIVLSFVSVRTGAVVATKQVILPPPGMANPATMPDPCLNTTAEAIAKAGSSPVAGPPMVVALMVIRHGVFQKAAAATASVQVTVPGANGERQLAATIPLYMATMIHGRNTPIEVIR